MLEAMENNVPHGDFASESQAARLLPGQHKPDIESASHRRPGELRE